jgi:transposase, IS5 family
MAKPRDERQKDLLRPALDQIIDMGHPLVRLAEKIDWLFLVARFSSVCQPGRGQPGLPPRLGARRLQELKDLYDRRLIRKREYDERRKAILDAL